MKIKSKKTILLSSILIGLSAFSYANEFNVIISKGQNIYNSGKISEPNYSKWYDVGSPYNCIERYNPADYKLGEVFTQIEDCDQKQERTVTVIEIVDGNTNETVTKENQIVKVENSYSETGTGNYKTGETNEVYGNWTDVNGHYNCEDWTPNVSEINLNEAFTQTRDCSQDQQRTVDIYDVWANGEETHNRTETESQTISESETQAAIGTKNYIVSETNGDWNAWVNVNTHYDCGVWSPDPSTVNLGDSFTQTRSCLQDQTRDRDIFDVWADGSQTFNRKESESQTISEDESQPETGTKNYLTGNQRVEHSSWIDDGGHYNCQSWSPTPAEVYNGTSYTQNRNCSQNQTRVKTTYDIWADGSETLATTENESQVISEVEAQGAVGTYLAKSCKEILNTQGSTGSKAYTIHLDNTARTVYCDMVTDGGGWTIVADQNLYFEGYPTAGGLPDDNPNNTQNTRLTRRPKYSEYAIKSVIDLHGAPYDASVAPEFRKFNTGTFGEVEVDMISFLFDKSDYQNGRAKDEYVMFNGVPWGDSNSHPHYIGYYWFNKNSMTYYHWGQTDIWGHIVNSDLYRIASTETGYARTAGCGNGWAENNCRLAKTAWVNRNIIKQKAVFMVR